MTPSRSHHVQSHQYLHRLGTAMLLAFAVASLATANAIAQSDPPDPTSAPTPQLKLSTERWDFGPRWKGEILKTSITATNVGGAPLHIASIKTSCGCTVADLKQKTLPPGASEQIDITYDTSTRMKDVHQRVILLCDDPSQHERTIVITGTMKDAVVLSDPLGVNLGRIGASGSASSTLDLDCKYDRPLRLKLGDVIGNHREHVDLRLEEVQPGEKYRLHVRTMPPLPFGAIHLKVALQTDAERIPQIEIPVRGHVQPPVMVVPNRVFVPGDTPVRTDRMIRMVSWRDRAVQVTELRSSDPGVTAEVMPPAPGVQKRNQDATTTAIRISVPPGAELPDAGATLTIVTSDPEYRELTVEVVKQKPTHP